MHSLIRPSRGVAELRTSNSHSLCNVWVLMISYGVAVLLAGEIIPQALCKSYALLIGNYCAGMVRVLCYAVGIISWPVSKVLDYVLGNEHTVTYLLLLNVLLAAPGSLLCRILQQCCIAGLLCCISCVRLPLPCCDCTLNYSVTCAYLALDAMLGHLPL